MQSKKIATCGLLCALAVVVMLIGSLIWVGVYAAPLLSIWLLLPIERLYGRRASFTAYAAVSIIGFILLPDRELALFYCCFGWWPSVRPSVQKIKNRRLRTAVKIVIYLAVTAVMLYTAYRILGIVLPEEGGIFAPIPWMPIPLSVIDLVLIAAGALLFLFCDVTLDAMSAAITKKVEKLMRMH